MYTVNGRLKSFCSLLLLRSQYIRCLGPLEPSVHTVLRNRDSASLHTQKQSHPKYTNCKTLYSNTDHPSPRSVLLNRQTTAPAQQTCVTVDDVLREDDSVTLEVASADALDEGVQLDVTDAVGGGL